MTLISTPPRKRSGAIRSSSTIDAPAVRVMTADAGRWTKYFAGLGLEVTRHDDPKAATCTLRLKRLPAEGRRS